MAAIIENKPSFKEFKETVQLQKFGGKMMDTFLLHYERLENGWKYRIPLHGCTKEAALKAAYYLLFSHHSVEGMLYAKKKVLVSAEGFKCPLSYNFKDAYNCSNFKYLRLKDTLISAPKAQLIEHDLVY